MYRAASPSRVERLAPEVALRRRLRYVLAPVAVLALAATAMGQAKDEVRTVFFQSLQKSGSIQATLIQSKRIFDGGRNTVKYSVTLDDKGRSRRTVIQPISMEGTIWIDDGKQWATINTNERAVVIQPSPLQDRLDARARMRLIEANYLLQSEGDVQIAGRRALVVRAVPKEKVLPERRYSIDRGNYLLLRIETQGSSGKMDVLLDTLAASFPRDLDGSLFQIPRSGYKVRVTDYPKPIKNLGAASQVLGFRPRIPSELPFGFQITQKHLVGSPESQFLALRLSDGFASLTVYQWDSNKRYAELPYKRGDGTDDEGVSFKVFGGDVPSSVRQRIAEAFLKPLLFDTSGDSERKRSCRQGWPGIAEPAASIGSE